MRATFHSGRYKKIDGERVPYSPKHLDRDFDVTKSDHIDPTKPCYIHFIENSMAADYSTFEEQEQAFYKCNFGEHISQQNAKMIKSRRKDKCKTVEDYRKSIKTCPEEVIMQVGKYHNDTKQIKSVPPDELEDMCWEFIEWHWDRYPQAVILNFAMHCDEPKAAPHIHMRKVWISEDENGVKCVNQTKALQDMGVALPDPSKPVDRTNNLKMTYTADCREKWETIVRSHGYELEERLEKSKTGLTHEQYIANQISELIDKKQAALDEREAEINEKASEINSKARELNEHVRINKKNKEVLQRRTEALEDKERQVAEQAKQNELYLKQLQRMAAEIGKQIKIKNQVASLENKYSDIQGDLQAPDV